MKSDWPLIRAACEQPASRKLQWDKGIHWQCSASTWSYPIKVGCWPTCTGMLAPAPFLVGRLMKALVSAGANVLTYLHSECVSIDKSCASHVLPPGCRICSLLQTRRYEGWATCRVAAGSGRFHARWPVCGAASWYREQAGGRTCILIWPHETDNPRGESWVCSTLNATVCCSTVETLTD